LDESENRETGSPRGRILRGMELDQDACYRAVVARDARFDGKIFGGVRTTGIYCRPICPARTPKRENIRFYRSAAEAEGAGFRPCLRCRPETAPDMGAWRGTSNTVSRGLALIEAGALDGGDVEALAGRLGVGERQLRRLFRQHLGAAPVSVAQTRRVLLAKQLIQETRMPMAEVALAAGFGSVRRFNETFQRLYHRPPSALRRGKAPEAAPGEGVRLMLAYRPPYDWDGMLAALAARAAPLEQVENGRWMRSLEGGGAVLVEPCGRDALAVHVSIADIMGLPGVLARVRRVFDLAADPAVVGAHLSADPALAPLVTKRPGLRLPGDWNVEDPGALTSDRLEGETERAAARAEGWRPWRAYGAAHLGAEGLSVTALIEQETRHDEAA